jgi:hypothetical protein
MARWRGVPVAAVVAPADTALEGSCSVRVGPVARAVLPSDAVFPLLEPRRPPLRLEFACTNLPT